MTDNRYKILWADDEIDLLKPHVMFLEAKGYDVATVKSGRDALDLLAGQSFDLIILDEHMPGLSGIETLQRSKLVAPHTPVVMITKSEEEDIMNQAIGSKIADYLIKPVNPSQILLSVKKLLHSPQLVNERAATDYRQAFSAIDADIAACTSIGDWYDLYSRLVYWDLELSSADTGMSDMLMMQKNEANAAFTRFVKRNYERWMQGIEAPMMSRDIFRQNIFPLLDNGEKVWLVVVDNFRLDQWRTVAPLLSDRFAIDEQMYMSILPTATQYARNALFAGLMPADIARMFPDLWIDEDEDEGKNVNESPLIASQFDRFRRRCRFSYARLNDSEAIERLTRDIASLDINDLNVAVINFIDILSHARTESRMIRELASTDAAYRSITLSWFRHSGVLDLFHRIADRGHRIILTTDHGTIRVDNPLKVIGDKNTNTNLRYKVGRNLNYNPRQVYEIKRPDRFGLPAPNVSSTYIFATGRDFFAYPNNYNHYAQYYSGTFQHGGISLEEMVVPIVTLTAK